MKAAINNMHYRSLVGTLILAGVILAGCAGPGVKPAGQAGDTSGPITPQDYREYQQALTLIEGGDPARGASALDKLTQRYPGQVEMWVNLAIAHYKAKDYPRALSAVEKALQLNTQQPEAYNLKGLIATEQGDYLIAEQALLSALALDTHYAHAHYNIALVYDIYLQDLGKAIHHYQAYLAAVPEDADTDSWVEQLKRALDQS